MSRYITPSERPEAALIDSIASATHLTISGVAEIAGLSQAILSKVRLGRAPLTEYVRARLETVPSRAAVLHLKRAADVLTWAVSSGVASMPPEILDQWRRYAEELRAQAEDLQARVGVNRDDRWGDEDP